MGGADYREIWRYIETPSTSAANQAEWVPGTFELHLLRDSACSSRPEEQADHYPELKSTVAALPSAQRGIAGVAAAAAGVRAKRRRSSSHSLDLHVVESQDRLLRQRQFLRLLLHEISLECLGGIPQSVF